MDTETEFIYPFLYESEIPDFADEFQAVAAEVQRIQPDSPSDIFSNIDGAIIPVESEIEKIEGNIPEQHLFELPVEERRSYLPVIKYVAILHALHDLLEMGYWIEADPDTVRQALNLEEADDEIISEIENHFREVEETIETEERYILLVDIPEEIQAEEEEDADDDPKERERRVLKQEQKEQFAEASVRRFIRDLEDGRGDGQSIRKLITDGAELRSDLESLTELDDEEITAELDNLVEPYLQPIPKASTGRRTGENQASLANYGVDIGSSDLDSDNWTVVDPTQTEDKHTGLRLQDIWRYFRYSWLTPYNTVPGRNINFLIRDGARDNDPVMGIATLGSPMMNFGTRDDHIGWTEHGLRSRWVRKHRVNEIERQLPKEERTEDKSKEKVQQIEWLETKDEHQARRKQIAEQTREAVERTIEEAIGDVRFDDFVEGFDGVLSDLDELAEEHFVNPTPADYENTRSALKRLEGVARYVIASNTNEEEEIANGNLASFANSGNTPSDQKLTTEATTDSGNENDEEEQTTAERVKEEYELEGIDIDAVEIKDENSEKISDPEIRSETALFVRKRAETLQSLLHARFHLLRFQRESDTASAKEFITKALQPKSNPNLNRALRTALREIKKRRSGACMMNIMVCGAIPPYNEILGGKLVAMALTGPKTIETYRDLYGNQISEIASGMKGEEVKKPTELVFLDTTGLFEEGSAQYDRIRLPVGGNEIRYEEIGLTSGFGTIQFGAETRKWLSNVTRVDEDRKVVRGRFGEGISPRLRKIRQGLTKCGLSGDLLNHKSRRIIYAIDLAENARPYLRGECDTPNYYWDFEDIDAEQQQIYDFWKQRWVSMRVQKDWVLDRIEKFDPENFLLSNKHSEYFQKGEDATLL